MNFKYLCAFFAALAKCLYSLSSTIHWRANASTTMRFSINASPCPSSLNSLEYDLNRALSFDRDKEISSALILISASVSRELDFGLNMTIEPKEFASNE